MNRARVGVSMRSGNILIAPRGKEGTGQIALELDMPDAMDLIYQIISYRMHNAPMSVFAKLLQAQGIIADVEPTIYSGRPAP